MKRSVLQDFAKYVSLNVLGMLGLSFYILADTFFVAKKLGSLGIAALNFSISIYSLIHGIGLMIAIGGATRYSILISQGKKQKADSIFTHSLIMAFSIGLLFVILGIFGRASLAKVLGANQDTLLMTQTYLGFIMVFAPAFILNNVILAFVRNDQNPQTAMGAMLIGSVANVVLDYIFMFRFDMGMLGAALATSLAPIISMGVLSLHFIRGKNSFRPAGGSVSFKTCVDITLLGFSAFINEISSAISLITFNLVILNLEGNLGVASYGIVANLALIGVAIFTGLAQGIQPLVSKGHGAGDKKFTKRVFYLAVFTAFLTATLIYIVIFAGQKQVTAFFNSEENPVVKALAQEGLRIYFSGFFFAGINITVAQYLSAKEKTSSAFKISLFRGFVFIVPLVLILSKIWEMKGVWFSFVAAEGLVFLMIYNRSRKKRKVTGLYRRAVPGRR